MRTKSQVYDEILCPEIIDGFSAHIREYLESIHLPKRDIIRYTMSSEEILLKIPQGTKIRLSLGKRFIYHYVTIETAGSALNVFAGSETDNGVLGNSILKNLGLSPEYSFSGNKNTYSFRIKKETVNPFVKLIIAIAAAAIIGFSGLLVPDAVRTAALELAFTPLHDTFLNILGCIAGPMIFLSVAWGIYGIGDAATLKRIGKRTALGYTGSVFVFCIIFALVSLLFFDLNFSKTGNGVSEASSIISMILGIFPKNIFSPFVDGNTLQIIFLAIVIGIAMLFLGKKTKAVAIAVEQINYIVQFLIEFISKLVPYFIFTGIVITIWSDTAAVLASVGKLFIVFIGYAVSMLLLFACYTGFRNRTNPIRVIRKAFPLFIVAITTASSAASFGTNMKICRQQYGISDSLSSFGLPLGIVLFKPSTAISFLSLSLVFAENFRVSVSPAWMIILILSCGILAIATPPIPGGAMTAYTILFTQIGIPAQALTVALTCDILLDAITTGFDEFMLPMALLNQSTKLGMTDHEILKRKKKG